jgi:hypothetical protein
MMQMWVGAESRAGIRSFSPSVAGTQSTAYAYGPTLAEIVIGEVR